MRHRKSGLILSRTSSHRRCMFRNMAVSLIMQEQIKTTTVKAKALRRFLEPLITRSKADTLANRRTVFNRLRDRKATLKLFNDLGKHFQNRPGGYIRILKCGFRAGDCAPVAYVQLVERAQQERQSG